MNDTPPLPNDTAPPFTPLPSESSSPVSKPLKKPTPPLGTARYKTLAEISDYFAVQLDHDRLWQRDSFRP